MTENTGNVLTELPPLSDGDCFYVVERLKTEFTFPLHHHRECELNFIEHGAGILRTVGDSQETIGDYDLTLITGRGLEHAWEQGSCDCSKRPVREVTIQFNPDLFTDNLLGKNQFLSINRMFRQAEQGISFPPDAIKKVYPQFDDIVSEKESFAQFLKLLRLFHDLSECSQVKVLSSSSFAHIDNGSESRRINVVKKYVSEHFAGEIRLQDVADLSGMTQVAFSRFFSQRTGKSFSDYIIDFRLGHAARQMLDTTKTISEICFESGFNNLSNFNRLFKKKKGVTPKEFRAHYKKNKYVI